MTRTRTLIILAAMAITMLFVWQANAPAHAKAPPPACSGANLLEVLKRDDPEGYAGLLAREKATPNGRGLLWKIERTGLPASYLFGTMHMSDERLTTLPGPVADALDGTHSVVLELAETADEGQMAKAVVRNLGLLAYSGGRSIEGVLSRDELTLLKRVLKKYGMAYASTRILKPWFIMLSLSLPLCEVERQKRGFRALDARIALAAKKGGAKIIGLETVKEQFSVFANLPEKTQKIFLLSTLRQSHSLDDQIETMKLLYLQRRPAALWELALYLSRKDTRENTHSNARKTQERTALKKFESELVIKRNKIMHKRALPHLTKGGAFIAIGAAHLPGETGLVNLLQKSGYRLSRVY